MVLRAIFFILILLVTSPAKACQFMHDGFLFREDIQALRKLEKQIATQNDIKSQIDASVWGVFLDPPSKVGPETGYARFLVGDVMKGDPENIIKLVSSKRDVTLNTEIHFLNLRKIDQSRWTDVGVTQDNLDWGPEICKISPNSSRCKLHKIKENKIKTECQALITEATFGCLLASAIPKICLKFRR